MISYRRVDSAPITGRIYDRLRARFGSDQVFMDIASIPIGTDYRSHIHDSMKRCDVLLTVIGPRWLRAGDVGTRRIDDPNDLVHLEVAHALERNIRVVPLLVEDAHMPAIEELPEDLKSLRFRNALRVDSGIDFHHHIDRLCAAIEAIGRSLTVPAGVRVGSPAPIPSPPQTLSSEPKIDTRENAEANAVELAEKRRKATELTEEKRKAAWLESHGREPIVIQGNCSLGRSPQSAVVLDSPKASRRHAIINLQNVGEFWLIDLGSSNGTFLNKRRVHQPVRLCDMDQIIVGDSSFTFRQPQEISDELRMTMAQQTMRQKANIPVWLLVADIEKFTPLSRSMVSEKLAMLVGGWVAACQEIVEEHHGEIDKYRCDGFLAYWHDDEKSAENVAAVLQKLKQLQRNEPRFRLVLHHGLVASGGMRSMGEESLIGKEVIFAFRMEKMAGSLGILLLASAAAKAKLESLMKCESAGVHQLKGFEGEYEFFKC